MARHLQSRDHLSRKLQQPMHKPSYRHIPRFKPIPSTPTRDIKHNFELRPTLPQWPRDRHLAAVIGRARAHLLHALNVLVHPSAAIITTHGHLPAPHHLSVVMAVTDLAAALGAIATVGVEAAVVAGAAGPAIATTEIGVLPQPLRAQRYVLDKHS
jgi:hypothetical protein